MLEPKTRNVDAEMLMEQLFRATELEVRVPLNLNVLDAARRAAGDEPEGGAAGLSRPSPRGAAAAQPRIRLAAVARRMEILRGQIIVYLNLDEVIRIIREDDDPKAEMMARWELTEVQVEAILNMRLRALRRLEEIEIRKELDAARRPSEASSTALLAEREAAMARDRQGGRDDAQASSAARRRSAAAAPRSAAAPAPIEIPVEALVEREPVTVLCSAKGWIRAVKGHNVAAAEQKYKEGDGPRFAVAGRDDRPADRLRHQRPLLHARRSTGCPAGAAMASRCG